MQAAIDSQADGDRAADGERDQDRSCPGGVGWLRRRGGWLSGIGSAHGIPSSSQILVASDRRGGEVLAIDGDGWFGYVKPGRGADVAAGLGDTDLAAVG